MRLNRDRIMRERVANFVCFRRTAHATLGCGSVMRVARLTLSKRTRFCGALALSMSTLRDCDAERAFLPTGDLSEILNNFRFIDSGQVSRME